MKYEECPEYWLDPADKCRNVMVKGAFYYCRALNNTKFGFRKCPFYKTTEQFYQELSQSRIASANRKLNNRPGKLIINIKYSLFKKGGLRNGDTCNDHGSERSGQDVQP